MPALQPVRGTTDQLGDSRARHNHVVTTAQQIALRYGYEDMATPIFEFTEVFSKPLGASSDVVTKETYSFEDRGGSSLTLRPEGTAGCMRAIISNGLTQSLPLRWFYHGPMFRYERPQKGRMRQFHQIGAELIGVAGASADAEIIGLGAQILDGLGVLEDTSLHLNSLGDSQSRAQYKSALMAYLADYEDQLSDDSKRRLTTNPLRILDSKDATDRQIVADAPSLSDALTDEAKRHFEQVTDLLDKAGIAWQFDPLLVRGLDYYAHTAFEFITDKLGAQGTVLGGGRYDGLSEMLGGPALPAVGFAAGIERLALLASPPDMPADKIAIFAADAEAAAGCFAIAHELRGAGLPVVMMHSGNMKKNMKSADRLKCRFSIIAGSDELVRNQVAVRNMADSTQRDIDCDQLIAYLRAELGLPAS